jgi:hypothetical protein
MLLKKNEMVYLYWEDVEIGPGARDFLYTLYKWIKNCFISITNLQFAVRLQQFQNQFFSILNRVIHKTEIIDPISIGQD